MKSYRNRGGFSKHAESFDEYSGSKIAQRRLQVPDLGYQNLNEFYHSTGPVTAPAKLHKAGSYGNMYQTGKVSNAEISSYPFSYDQYQNTPYRYEEPARIPATKQQANLWAPQQPTFTPSKQLQKRNMTPIDGYIYQVQFKRAHRNFVLAPSAPRDIIPGDFVKVEADRGEDMGIVLAKIPIESFEEVIPTAGYRGRGFSSGQGEKKYLYRIATPEERNALQIKVADEEKALEVKII